LNPLSAIHDHNRRAWDARAKNQERFARPAPDEQFKDPLAQVDPRGWLGDITARRVLCLAAGGGRQSALYAAAGAQVTVVDLSPQMLALDRQVARERGLDIRAVQGSMDDLSALPSASFDIVIQPVSTCYVADILAVYREVARVTIEGGLYVSQHKQPASLQAEVKPGGNGYHLCEPYYRQGPLPAVTGSLHREAGTLEFLHRWEELIGGLCRTGFVVEDLTEPYHADDKAEAGAWGHRSLYIAPYVRIKARRRGNSAGSTPPRLLLS
jgi:SAM-dependent methyltransferase